MKSYCVKQKKVTDCVSGSERQELAKNGRMMLKCVCAECGITKTKFISSKGASREGGALFDVHNSHSLEEIALKGLLNSGAYLARKGAAKAIRSDFAKKKIKQTANKYLDQALDSLVNDVSKKISGGATSTSSTGGALDIHKAIGKFPKPKKGWTLPGHNYTGPYNPLDKQLSYDPNTGQILEIYQQPTGKTDAVSMQHDVDYAVCGDDRKCKNSADRRMVAALDAIPYNERQWGHAVARNAINTKQRLGLGLGQRKKRRV